MGRFFTHLPLFAKYLAIMTSLMLVSYIVLASALTVFLSTRWTKETETLLTQNVKQNAEYCENLFAKCSTNEELNSAFIIICNNIGITSTAIDADLFFANASGDVLICPEDFNYEYSASSENCPIHRDYHLTEKVIEDAKKQSSPYRACVCRL